MRLVRFLIAGCAWIAFAVILAYLVAQRFFGEAHWPSTVVLYLPHGLLLVPLAGISFSLLLFGPRRLLILMTGAFLIVLFPIMGLDLSRGSAGALPHLRVLTYNVDVGKRSVDEIVAQIKSAQPDIVLLQETATPVNDAVTAAFPGWSFHATSQFFLATRYTVLDVMLPDKIPVAGKERSARFAGYTLETPFGPLDVFSMHPVSPRDGFEELRGEGLRAEIESGRIFAGDRHALPKNTAVRRAQVEAAAKAVAAAKHPFILAGDTNLPNGSGILAANFSELTDAWGQVGSGFGYTFPAHKYLPWMRIDRIFAGPGLRFTHAEVGTRRGSDHYCLFADVEKP